MVILYMTSHGWDGGGLAIDYDYFDFNEMDGKRLSNILDNSGIKWKAVIVSACYSGGLIPALKNDHTLILTSSNADRPSYGCGDDSPLTYFAEALIKDSLAKSRNLVDAFESARKIIRKREMKELIFFLQSRPQIFVGEAIRKRLKNWM